MKLITYFILLGSFALLIEGNLDLIRNFLNYKFLTKGYVFTCLTKRDKLNLGLKLSKILFHFVLLNIDLKANHENIFFENMNIGIIINGSCSDVKYFLNKFREYKNFNERKHWLILSNDTTISNYFENIPANVNSDVILATSRRNHFWDLFEIYNTGYHHGGHLEVKPIGIYNKNEGFVIKETRNKFWRRKNMGKVNVNVATMLSYPYKGELEQYMTSEKIDKDVDTLNRVGYSSIAQCLMFYNMSWTTILTHSWGYPDENMSYDGIIGEVQRKRADIGTGLYARSDRLSYVDYGASVYTLQNGIMFLGQGNVLPYLIYIRPLDTNVWYVLVLLVLLIQIILRIVQKVDNVTSEERNENSWSQSIICILGHLCQQGASDVPRLYSGRILIFTLSQFALLLFQLYSASVVSSLLIKPPSDIHSLDDLVRSDMEFGCEDLKYVRDLFNTTNNPVLKELKLKKLKEANYMPPKEGLSLVNKGTFAYHTELKIAYPMIERTFSNTHVCDLQILKLVRDANLYTNYQKNSPFRDMMNVCIRRLDETGLTDHLQKIWGFRKPICFREPYLAASVGITEFLPLATLLFVGYLISLLILTIEIFVHRIIKKKNLIIRKEIKRNR